MGTRRVPGGGHARAARECRLPAGHPVSGASGRHGRHGRCARRRRGRGDGGAVSRHARHCPRGRAVHRRRDDRGERDQGARAAHALPGVGDSPAGTGPFAPPCGRVGPQLRGGARARTADRGVGRVSRRASGRGGSGGVSRALLPPLRHERHRGRRVRRRAQERDRDRGGAGRRAGAGPQRAGRAHHARAGRDLASRVRRRRPP